MSNELRHSRGHTRRMCWKHAIRKRNIDRDTNNGYSQFDDLHSYSKRKPIGKWWLRELIEVYGPNSVRSKSKSDQRRIEACNSAIKAMYEDLSMSD